MNPVQQYIFELFLWSAAILAACALVVGLKRYVMKRVK